MISLHTQHIYKSLLHKCMNAHTPGSISLLLPINLMKMDLSNLFPDTRTRTSQPVPCVVSSSFALLFLRPVFPSLRWIRCATRPKSEKGKKFVTFPNKTLTRQKNNGINHLTFQYCITLSAENQGGH